MAPSKEPTFRPFKPIAEVLKDCRPEDVWAAKRTEWLAILHDAAIGTATDWQHLPDSDKAALKVAGLPQAVITSLNEAVRVGLLLPAFKYAEKCAFLQDPALDHGNYNEVNVIHAEARNVDVSWDLTRTDCVDTCLNMRITIELTQKYFIRRWTTHPKNKMRDGRIYNYPLIHDLQTLYKMTVDKRFVPCIARVSQCREPALVYVTECGQETSYMNAKIQCKAFYANMQWIDPYLMSLWDIMRDLNVERHS